MRQDTPSGRRGAVSQGEAAGMWSGGATLIAVSSSLAGFIASLGTGIATTHQAVVTTLCAERRSQTSGVRRVRAGCRTSLQRPASGTGWRPHKASVVCCGFGRKAAPFPREEATVSYTGGGCLTARSATLRQVYPTSEQRLVRQRRVFTGQVSSSASLKTTRNFTPCILQPAGV